MHYVEGKLIFCFKPSLDSLVHLVELVKTQPMKHICALALAESLTSWLDINLCNQFMDSTYTELLAYIIWNRLGCREVLLKPQLLMECFSLCLSFSSECAMLHTCIMIMT